MRAPTLLLLALFTSSALAVSSWGFENATVTVQGKKAEKSGPKVKLSENKPSKEIMVLNPADTLKILLTTKEGSTAKRPHQTFLHLQDTTGDLETSFPFQVKESGKAMLELTQKDIPTQLLSSKSPLRASLFIASFGSSKPYKAPAFDLSTESDPSNPIPQPDKFLRYQKQAEIHHTFKPDPASPPKIVTIFFTGAVIAALPALLIIWLSLGANLQHLSQAFRSSPIPHTLFSSSILALEGVFFMYYTHWKLFQVLPIGLGIGLVTFLSGSRALREVQQRRLERSR